MTGSSSRRERTRCLLKSTATLQRRRSQRLLLRDQTRSSVWAPKLAVTLTRRRATRTWFTPRRVKRSGKASEQRKRAMRLQSDTCVLRSRRLRNGYAVPAKWGKTKPNCSRRISRRPPGYVLRPRSKLGTVSVLTHLSHTEVIEVVINGNVGHKCIYYLCAFTYTGKSASVLSQCT